ncbi:MAG: heme exporter protein CcmB [Gaiellales bacterium]
MRLYLSDALVLARKDLVLELRTRDTVPAMLLFVLSALVVFHFAVPGNVSAETERMVALGLLWIAIVFTALVGLARAFAAERERRLLDALILAPCDRSAIWLGKTLAVVGFLLLAELIAVPAFALFFETVDALTIVAILLANVGIAAVGTLLAAVSAASRTRELLLPLLFLPLAIPIVVGGVGASIAEAEGRFLGFLALYDAVFGIISWATFEYVVTE